MPAKRDSVQAVWFQKLFPFLPPPLGPRYRVSDVRSAFFGGALEMYDQGNSNNVLDGRENLTAMRALWCGVIQIAWDDVFFESKASSREVLGKIALIRWKAARWFGSRDFMLVCALAGLDGDAVMTAFKKKMKDLE